MTRRSDFAVPARKQSGVALVAVLYFLVLAALTSIAVVFGTRAAVRRAADSRTDAALIAAADVAVHSALASWRGSDGDAQPIGTTIESHPTAAQGATVTLWVTRLTLSNFSLVAESRGAAGGPARRVVLFVRVPAARSGVSAALTSAVDVSVGDGVTIDTDGTCRDTVGSAIDVAPLTNVVFDAGLPVDRRPPVQVDSSAADSTTYLQIGDWSWDDLVQRADIRLGTDAVVAPAPNVDAGGCRATDSNWGAPGDTASPCYTRVPVVYAPGDLTIAGGAGQGVLLVDGRLTITGPFRYSGQIVVRRGLETHADAISISGAVYAWRATSESTRTRASRGDVVLTHGTALRGSRCDAAHGMTSFLQPRAVRAHAWTELF